MKAQGRSKEILVVVAAALLFVLSVTAVGAVVYDYATREIVTKGVTLVGHDLTGMALPQVRNTVEQAVSTPMMQPLTVQGDNKSWTLDPKGIVAVDVDAMVKQAYAPRHKATLVDRLVSDVAGNPLPADVEPVYSVDASAVASWVGETATQVDRKPINAVRKALNYTIRITPSAAGASVVQTAALEQICQALTADAALATASRVASLPVKVLKPAVHESSFKTAIIVSLSRCRIYLFKGAKLVKSYPCAPGRPGFPTPRGDFVIQSRQRYAPWINPGTPWAASMPAVIPGGPGNPMGTTKVGINYPGVFMHGIPPGEFGSIGTHASHGCMRMFPSDALDLYNRVAIGDPVWIRN
jgi:lipoprotein-anchoring transpeptidase ErfK/SrfK